MRQPAAWVKHVRVAADAGAKRVRVVAAAALDLVLPTRCLACGTIVEAPGGLCAACWRETRFVAPPQCARCGLPFEHGSGAGTEELCGACTARPPVYDRARAALIHDAASRRLAGAFKFRDRTDAAPVLARWMARAGEALLARADVLAPVPLHRRRLLARRYNQAALLARAVGRLAARPVVPDLLVRRRPTRPQLGLDRRQRRANVGGAFVVRASRLPRIVGRRVLLVDDVLTTGATADACARALLRAGAAGVDVLTLTRVPP